MVVGRVIPEEFFLGYFFFFGGGGGSPKSRVQSLVQTEM